MEVEEGEFVNFEVVFVYCIWLMLKIFKEWIKDMYFYLVFYLFGNIKVFVWVDLQGIIGMMCVCLQFILDLLFFQFVIIIFFGQFKVDFSCVFFSKYVLNIMDVFMISNFVQFLVDVVMVEYVVLKSLMLDLKDMFVGDDFKKDINVKGVLVVNIK